MEAIAGPSRSQAPQPGDGSYLAHSQPGDGRFLTNGNPHGPRQNGVHRGRGGRGRGRGAHTAEGSNGITHRAHETAQAQSSTLESSLQPQKANGALARSAHPRRPVQPREIIPIANGNALPGSSQHSTPPDPAAEGLPKSKRNNQSRRPRAKNDENGAANGLTSSKSHQLDPSVSSFVPASQTDTTPIAPFSSRPASPQQSARPKSRKKPKPKQPVQTEKAAPAPVKSSRRAAFDQQTKLTTHADATSSAASSPSTSSVILPREEKVDQGKNKGPRRKEEKDDLVSRLTRGLKSRPYLECPIVSCSYVQKCVAYVSASTPSTHLSPSGPAFHLQPLHHRLPSPTRSLLTLPSTTRPVIPLSISAVFAIGQTGPWWKREKGQEATGKTRRT